MSIEDPRTRWVELLIAFGALSFANVHDGVLKYGSRYEKGQSKTWRRVHLPSWVR